MREDENYNLAIVTNKIDSRSSESRQYISGWIYRDDGTPLDKSDTEYIPSESTHEFEKYESLFQLPKENIYFQTEFSGKNLYNEDGTFAHCTATASLTKIFGDIRICVQCPELFNGKLEGSPSEEKEKFFKCWTQCIILADKEMNAERIVNKKTPALEYVNRLTAFFNNNRDIIIAEAASNLSPDEKDSFLNTIGTAYTKKTLSHKYTPDQIATSINPTAQELNEALKVVTEPVSKVEKTII